GWGASEVRGPGVLDGVTRRFPSLRKRTWKTNHRKTLSEPSRSTSSPEGTLDVFGGTPAHIARSLTGTLKRRRPPSTATPACYRTSVSIVSADFFAQKACRLAPTVPRIKSAVPSTRRPHSGGYTRLFRSLPHDVGMPAGRKSRASPTRTESHRHSRRTATMVLLSRPDLPWPSDFGTITT